MKISLENYLRNKLDEVESVHSFELATDTIRCWIDEYNEQLRQYNVCGRSEQLPTDEDCIIAIKSFNEATEILNISDVISRLFSEVENEFKVKSVLFMTYREETGVVEFYEVDENEEKVDKYLKRVSINDLSTICTHRFKSLYPKGNEQIKKPRSNS